MPPIQFPYGLKNSAAAYQEFLAEKLSSYYQEAPLFGKHEGLVISSTPWGKAVHYPGRTPVHSNNPVIEQEHSCIVAVIDPLPYQPGYSLDSTLPATSSTGSSSPYREAMVTIHDQIFEDEPTDPNEQAKDRERWRQRNAALAERRRNAARRQEFLVRNLEQDFLVVSGNQVFKDLTANILAAATGLQSLEQTPQVQ